MANKFNCLTPAGSSRANESATTARIVHDCTMAEPQAEGCYPRVNAGSMGNFPGMIVAAVGRIHNGNQLECSDGQRVQLNLDSAEPPEVNDAMVYEIVGQVMSKDELAVSAACCSGGELWSPVLAADIGGRRRWWEVVASGPAPKRGGSALEFSLTRHQMFVARPLSEDTDLSVYDKMLQIQHNPKYQQYFQSS